MRRFVFSFAAVMNLLLLDQVVKAAAIQKLKGAPPLEVLPFFNLAYVENRGCAWGMFQGQVWPLAVFGAVAFIFLIWKRKSVFPSGIWGLVAEHLLYAGILGNLIDRVYYRFVVDMFDFHWGVHHFPCFNVADSCITVAAFIMILSSFTEKRQSEAEPVK
jgi:signal peptidase II